MLGDSSPGRRAAAPPRPLESAEVPRDLVATFSKLLDSEGGGECPVTGGILSGNCRRDSGAACPPAPRRGCWQCPRLQPEVACKRARGSSSKCAFKFAVVAAGFQFASLNAPGLAGS